MISVRIMLTEIHVSELQLPVDPSLLGSRQKVLVRLCEILFDPAAVQVHQPEPALPHRIVEIGRFLEILERGIVVLLYLVAAVQVNLKLGVATVSGKI